MPARRKSPRRSKSRSKSPRRSPKRRSSGKARRAAARRSPKRRAYKGVDARVYGMMEDGAAGPPAQGANREAAALIDDLSPAGLPSTRPRLSSRSPMAPDVPQHLTRDMKLDLAKSFARYIVQDMTAEEEERFVSALATELDTATQIHPREDELAPFSMEDVRTALRMIEISEERMADVEAVANDPVAALIGYQEEHEQDTTQREVRMVLTRTNKGGVGPYSEDEMKEALDAM